MILNLSIQNFLSFKEKAVFSFEATKDNTHEATHVVKVAPGVRIGKLGVIYGANASGKSNLLEAFDFLIRFWRSKPESKTEKTGVVPFLLDSASRNKPSVFSLTFYIDGQKHVYELVLYSDKVISETLSYYPGTQPASIFYRLFEDNVSKINFGSTIKVSSAAKDEISVKCLANTSLFAAYESVNVNIPELEKVVSWINHNFLPVVEPLSELTNYVKKRMQEDKTVRSFILNFLKEADYNISDITTKTETKKVSETFLRLASELDIPAGERNRLLKEKTLETIHALFTHNVTTKSGTFAEHQLSEALQSRGTLRTLGVAGVISQAVAEDSFLAIDEIESSLHPKLVEFILEQFLKLSDRAQLLVTTHNDSLLEEQDLLRKDNVWFTSKKKDGSSELYSLSDFQGLGRISSIQKAYKYGKFGAIPNI